MGNKRQDSRSKNQDKNVFTDELLYLDLSLSYFLALDTWFLHLIIVTICFKGKFQIWKIQLQEIPIHKQN